MAKSVNIQDIINKDERIKEIKQKYYKLINQKTDMIMHISHLEADIIKLSGEYEAIAKEIVAEKDHS